MRLSLALSAVVASAVLGGCASTDLGGRHVTRLGPLRAGLVHPAGIDGEPILLQVGPDVLDDDEMERMTADLASYFASATSRIASEHASETEPKGTARVQRCSLRASPTPRATVYLARCRVALELGGVPVVEVEAHAERRARARAVTEEQAKEIKKQVRNPLLDYEDSRAALQSALDEALRLLVTGAEPRPLPGEAEIVVDEQAMGASARRRVTTESGPALAAACVDLARFGDDQDGAALAPHLEDESALVRRACATAIGELGAKDAYDALRRQEGDPDPQAAAAIALALQRLRALYSDLPDDEPSKPSKSSTDGGGV